MRLHQAEEDIQPARSLDPPSPTDLDWGKIIDEIVSSQRRIEHWDSELRVEEELRGLVKITKS